MSAATRRRILVTILSVFLLTSAALAAQFSSSLSGPVLGYVFDEAAGKLRPVRGIAGSATVGAAVDPGFAASAVLALDGRHFVASTAANPELVLLTLDGSQASTLVIPGVPANPTRGAASLQGGSAAFYYADTRQVRIVSGLPQEPRTIGSVQVDHSVTRMAVNNDGSVLVYAVRETEGESVYSWTALSGSARFLTSAVSVSGIAITPGGDAIVTDRGADEVFAIWDVAGGAVRRLLADAREGVSSPAGVAVSSGNRIYVANPGSANVLVLDANGRFLKAHRCTCAISGLYLMRDSLFRLTDGIQQTIFMLDASSAEERILFVPPPLD